jgi:hypothetical protein
VPDGVIYLTDDAGFSANKAVDQEAVAFGGAPTTRFRQRVRLGGALAAELMAVKAAALDGTEYAACVRALPDYGGAVPFNPAPLAFLPTAATAIFSAATYVACMLFANQGDQIVTVSVVGPGASYAYLPAVALEPREVRLFLFGGLLMAAGTLWSASLASAVLGQVKGMQ